MSYIYFAAGAILGAVLGVLAMALATASDSDGTEPQGEPERHRGEWIEDEYGFPRCSNCGMEREEREIQTPYCPYCGAYMRGGTENADGSEG